MPSFIHFIAYRYYQKDRRIRGKISADCAGLAGSNRTYHTYTEEHLPVFAHRNFGRTFPD